MNQYLSYLGGPGSTGVSVVSNVPVSQELRDRIGWSFLHVGIGHCHFPCARPRHGACARYGSEERRSIAAYGAHFLSLQNLPVFFVGRRDAGDLLSQDGRPPTL